MPEMIRDMVRTDTYAGRQARDQKPAAKVSDAAYHQKIHRVRPLLGFILLGGLGALLLALPLLVLLWRGVGAGIAGYLAEPSVVAAARLSLITSGISLLFTLLLGTPLAYVLARWSFRYKAVVETIIDLPIVLPPMVAGIGLLLAFGRNGLLGGPLHELGIRLPFTTAAVIFAQTFVSAPLYIRAARLGFGAVRPDMIEAAYTDGASEHVIFRLCDRGGSLLRPAGCLPGLQGGDPGRSLFVCGLAGVRRLPVWPAGPLGRHPYSARGRSTGGLAP